MDDSSSVFHYIKNELLIPESGFFLTIVDKDYGKVSTKYGEISSMSIVEEKIHWILGVKQMCLFDRNTEIIGFDCNLVVAPTTTFHDGFEKDKNMDKWRLRDGGGWKLVEVLTRKIQDLPGRNDIVYGYLLI